MLSTNRKASIGRETLPVIPAVDFLEDDADSPSTDWVYKRWVRRLLRLFAFASLISVSANTPGTFVEIPWLAYTCFLCDCVVGILFFTEMISKMLIKGLYSAPDAYLRSRWCQFDAAMVFFLFASIALQSKEIQIMLGSCASPMDLKSCPELKEFWLKYGFLSILRSPRPLILIRVFRAVLKFQLPKTRLTAILQRSSQQVYNVTTFLLFFMSLYGILGVQFFGSSLDYHCVKKTANKSDIKLQDLAIPDMYCSSDVNTAMDCGMDMQCVVITPPIKDRASYSGFKNFPLSLFTVYQAASQEGWVFIMYRAMDSLPSWKGPVFFISMIFFLAWLVKNVFIAVLIETFAEIRVQFQQMWVSPRNASDSDSSKVFQFGDEQRWRLVAVDDSKPRGLAPQFFQRVVKSTGFNVIMMSLVLTNAIVAAALHFNHEQLVNKKYDDKYDAFYYVEIVFTVLFDIEALFKVWCLGWSTYWQRSLHKFELILCFGNSLHCIPQLYRSMFTYFQVLRCVRLIKASPMLEDFCFKIFGPVKKLGSLIIFTMFLLVITSTISMQLFCFVSVRHIFESGPRNATSEIATRFSTFPMAFMSMFQILTQKGWTVVMHDTMVVMHRENRNSALTYIVAIYFVIYHLFVTLIILSLFVAVILDNLELDEDIKKLKQLKLREMSAETQEKLPMRLRIFEKFPNRPQMIKLTRIFSDFIMPKIRDSFMRQFAAAENGCAEDFLAEEDLADLPADLRSRVRGLKGQEKRCAVAFIVNECSKTRVVGAADLATGGLSKSLLSQQHHIRMDRRSMRNRNQTNNFGGGSKNVGQLLPNKNVHFRENGEAVQLTSARRNDELDIKHLQQKAAEAERKRNQIEEDLRENHPFFDKPLFTVGRESRFREFCRVLVEAQYSVRDADAESNGQYKNFHKILGLIPYIDWIMLFITMGSIVCMMFETPLERVMKNSWMEGAEYVFFVSMTVEISMKVLANGFFFTPKALVRDFAGILDLFIYMISFIFVFKMLQLESVAPGSQEQVLMILRCLRPLRLFCLVPHMRMVVYELVRGFREILMVSILLVILMFIFAVYGVHLFGGKLGICNDRNESVTFDKHNCSGYFRKEIQVTMLDLSGENPKILVPRIWANPRNFNFDNIGNAMLALFEVLSLEGWIEVRDVIRNRVGAYHAIYIHLFVFIGCMIGLTLFVGVVIANYSENKGTALLTVDQRRWLDLKGRIKLTQPLHIPPRPSESQRVRAAIYDIAQNILFKRASVLLVILNVILLFWPWNESSSNGLTITATVFTLLFVIEVVLKLISLTPRGYWQSRRNRFDLLVTVMGVIWVILHYSLHNTDKKFISNNLGWIVIVLRYFTITGKHATLKMLMLTVVMSMLKSFFIIMSMFLLMLVYALAGVILFGAVKYGENLNRHANFQSSLRAIALLVRIVTGEDWNKIMHDCMIQPPFCTMADQFWNSNCGNFQAALIYFCSFYVIITYIMLNLLVGIIMENFSLFYSNEEDALLSYSDIRQFQNTWNFVDVHRKGMLNPTKAKVLLRLLKGRLEVDMSRDKLLFKHMCKELERLMHAGREDVSFHDVLNMLSYRSVDIRKSLQLEELMAREELEYTIEEEVAKQTIREWLDSCLKRIRAKESSNIVKHLRATNDATGGFVFHFETSALPDGQLMSGNNSAPSSGNAHDLTTGINVASDEALSGSAAAGLGQVCNLEMNVNPGQLETALDSAAVTTVRMRKKTVFSSSPSKGDLLDMTDISDPYVEEVFNEAADVCFSDDIDDCSVSVNISINSKPQTAMGFKRKRGSLKSNQLPEVDEDEECAMTECDKEDKELHDCKARQKAGGVVLATAAEAAGVPGSGGGKKRSITHVIDSGCREVKDWWRQQNSCLELECDHSSGSEEER